MTKKRTTSKKAFAPITAIVIFALVLLGLWLYYAQTSSTAPAAASLEKRVKQLLQENPDAEIFKDPANLEESKKKSPPE